MKSKFRFSRKALAYPYMLFLLLFVVTPLVIILINAFLSPDNKLTLNNFVEFFSNSGGGMTVLGNSLLIGIVTTVICLAIGYPCAYLLAKYHASNKVFVLMFILPMWINFLIRTLSTKAIFLALDIKLGMGTVLFGMVYNYLPYMILPLHTTLVSIDHSYIEAAEDLGANPLRVVTRVVLPLSVPGVVSGVTMVFMPAVTTFAVSRLMSSGNIYLMGDMIEEYFITMNNRNVGSAMSLVMMILILISIGLLRRGDPDGEGGGLW